MRIGIYWTKKELAAMHADYTAKGPAVMAVMLGRSQRAVEAKAQELGLGRRPETDQDPLSALGAHRLASTIRAAWHDHGVAVRPAVQRAEVGASVIFVVRLPAISGDPASPRRFRPKVTSRTRQDWPPGSNARLLARRDAHRKLHFVGGVLRGLI